MTGKRHNIVCPISISFTIHKAAHVHVHVFVIFAPMLSTIFSEQQKRKYSHRISHFAYLILKHDNRCICARCRLPNINTRSHPYIRKSNPHLVRCTVVANILDIQVMSFVSTLHAGRCFLLKLCYYFDSLNYYCLFGIAKIRPTDREKKNAISVFSVDSGEID